MPGGRRVLSAGTVVGAGGDETGVDAGASGDAGAAVPAGGVIPMIESTGGGPEIARRATSPKPGRIAGQNCRS